MLILEHNGTCRAINGNGKIAVTPSVLANVHACKIANGNHNVYLTGNESVVNGIIADLECAYVELELFICLKSNSEAMRNGGIKSRVEGIYQRRAECLILIHFISANLFRKDEGILTLLGSNEFILINPGKAFGYGNAKVVIRRRVGIVRIDYSANGTFAIVAIIMT